jgi:hypothetical protein
LTDLAQPGLDLSALLFPLKLTQMMLTTYIDLINSMIASNHFLDLKSRREHMQCTKRRSQEARMQQQCPSANQ